MDYDPQRPQTVLGVLIPDWLILLRSGWLYYNSDYIGIVRYVGATTVRITIDSIEHRTACGISADLLVELSDPDAVDRVAQYLDIVRTRCLLRYYPTA